METTMTQQKCLYEILGVQPTASTEEIRSAYRKLAFQWHPDKIQQSGASPEACQEATFHFQDIGRAYEVLSDPSERSWYDSHPSGAASSAPPSDFDPFRPSNWASYFSPSVFSSGDRFSDSTGKGFYAVYGNIFGKLHQQEVSFARSRGLQVINPEQYPPEMGDLTTDYAHVQKFYNHWLGFSTVKDFSWLDEFKAPRGSNRKLRRLIEEDNKKIRCKARKEFNEAVHRLAAFVKGRDKRVLERQVEVERSEKERGEMRKARRKLTEEEEKTMKATQYEEPEWTKVESDPDEWLYDFDDSYIAQGKSTNSDQSTGRGKNKKLGKSSTSKSAAGGKLKKMRHDADHECINVCIVCSKEFKSAEQKRNHERSEKHALKLATLRKSFAKDDKMLEAISRVI